MCSLDISTEYTHWIQDQHYNIYYQVYFSHDINLITVKGRNSAFYVSSFKDQDDPAFQWIVYERMDLRGTCPRLNLDLLKGNKQQTSKKMTIHYLFLFMCMIAYLGSLYWDFGMLFVPYKEYLYKIKENSHISWTNDILQITDIRTQLNSKENHSWILSINKIMKRNTKDIYKKRDT